ncbi:DNA phosphorothioation-dependent restriction protein DptF [Bacillus sp. F19]|nr:DNA phosphorothioation-dependent restriction protein DptF [Bacillus sp. F19]
MSSHSFEFIQNLNPDLSQLGMIIDKIFYADPHGVLVKGRLFAEQLSKDVVKREAGLENLLYVRQVERIDGLEKEGLLTNEIAKSFDSIRYLGNQASHKNSNFDLETALKMHKNLFKVAVWYMEVYGDYEFVPPNYQHPLFKEKGFSNEELDELIDKKLSNQLKGFLDLNNRKIRLNTISDIDIENRNSKEDTHQTLEKKAKISGNVLHGSSLIYELSKLKESSQEAVENEKSFSSFKTYLHVERPIQNNMYEALKTSEKSNVCQLIILGGSVGDGKSHLLAYMNNTYPEMMKKFTIHNDATESFNPTKNSLDTLDEVLKPFSDDYIDNSIDKQVLAINLGVLHNFLESNYAKESYTKLSEFINKSDVFNSNSISKDVTDENFHLISFSDFHTFEITNQGPKSTYFKELFNRITSESELNPFYQAYIKDLENGYKGHVMTNYQLFKRGEVQEKISQLLIQALIKHKLIISTRALLNFIYDIIVPANLEDNLVFSSVIDETEFLLPNLLFGSKDRSLLLQVLSKLDPIHVRSKEIDQLLIELNNSHNVSDVFKSQITSNGIEVWIDSLEELGPFYELSSATRKILNVSMIRMGWCLSSNLEHVFSDSVYKSYMTSLYAFNTGDRSGLISIYRDTLKAIFEWKGQPKKNTSYIYLDDTAETMKIAQSLQLKPYIKHLQVDVDDVLNRFKKTLVIGFQDQQETFFELLEIDYPLYEKILKVLDGYRPNKKDKDDAIQFVEFIDKLMKLGSRKEQLLIHHSNENLNFKLEYDSFFGQFTFTRE